MYLVLYMLFLLSLGFCLNIIVLELIGYLGKIVIGVLLIWILILKSWLKLPTTICLIKCVTVFTAFYLCFLLLTLLITCVISDHVVMTCHFLLSKRFCLKIVSLWELSLSTNSLFCCLFHWICLTSIDCLIHTVCAILLPWVCVLFCLFYVLVIQCGCHWS